AIVLEHIQMVLSDDAVCLTSSPLCDGGDTKVHGHAFKRFGPPAVRRIRHNPIARRRVVDTQGAWLLTLSRLRPVHPKPEFQTILMCFVGPRGDALWELLRIGFPVAHSAKPASVHMKPPETELGRFAQHSLA